jgi:hypothetical protein
LSSVFVGWGRSAEQQGFGLLELSVMLKDGLHRMSAGSLG